MQQVSLLHFEEVLYNLFSTKYCLFHDFVFFCSNNTDFFINHVPKFKPTPSGKDERSLLSLCKNQCSCQYHSVLVSVIWMLTCVIARNLEVSRCAYFFNWWSCLAELWRLTVVLIVPFGVGAKRIFLTLRGLYKAWKKNTENILAYSLPGYEPETFRI